MLRHPYFGVVVVVLNIYRIRPECYLAPVIV